MTWGLCRVQQPRLCRVQQPIAPLRVRTVHRALGVAQVLLIASLPPLTVAHVWFSITITLSQDVFGCLAMFSPLAWLSKANLASKGKTYWLPCRSKQKPRRHTRTEVATKETKRCLNFAQQSKARLGKESKCILICLFLCKSIPCNSDTKNTHFRFQVPSIIFVYPIKTCFKFTFFRFAQYGCRPIQTFMHTHPTKLKHINSNSMRTLERLS